MPTNTLDNNNADDSPSSLIKDQEELLVQQKKQTEERLKAEQEALNEKNRREKEAATIERENIEQKRKLNKEEREERQRSRKEELAKEKADREYRREQEKLKKEAEKLEKQQKAEREKQEKQENAKFHDFLENIESKLNNIFDVRGTINEGITSAFGSNIITKTVTTAIDSVGGLFDSLFGKQPEEEKDPLVEAIKQQSESIRELIETVKDTETNIAVDKQTEAIERLIATIEGRGGLPNEIERSDRENSIPIKELETIQNYTEVLNNILLELKQPKTDEQLSELVKQNTEILSSQSETLDSILSALHGQNQLAHDKLEENVFESIADTLSGIGDDKISSDGKSKERPEKTESIDISDEKIIDEKPRFDKTSEPVTDVKPKSIWDRIKSDAFSVEKNVEGFKNLVKMMTKGLNKVYEKLDPMIRPIVQVAKTLSSAIQPLMKHTDFVKAQVDKFKDVIGRKFLKAEPTVETESRKDEIRSPIDGKPIESGESELQKETTESSPNESKIPGMDIPDIDIEMPDGKKPDGKPSTEKPGKTIPETPDLEQKTKPIPEKKSTPSKLSKLGKGFVAAAGGLAIMTAVTSGVDYVLGETADIGKQDISQEQLETDTENWNKMSTGEKIVSGAARGIEKFGSLIGLENISKEAQAARIEKESEEIAAKLGSIEEKQNELKQIQDVVTKQTTNQMPAQVNNIVNNNNQSVYGPRMNSENTESSFMRYLKSVF